MLSNLYPKALQPLVRFVVSGAGILTTDVAFELVFIYCVFVGCVALFTPELNVSVLLYTAYIVFAVVYAGL